MVDLEEGEELQDRGDIDIHIEEEVGHSFLEEEPYSRSVVVVEEVGGSSFQDKEGATEERVPLFRCCH